MAEWSEQRCDRKRRAHRHRWRFWVWRDEAVFVVHGRGQGRNSRVVSAACQAGRAIFARKLERSSLELTMRAWVSGCKERWVVEVGVA